MKKLVNASERVRVIPAILPLDGNSLGRIQKKRVAAYCRVSTDLEQQTTSFTIQSEYYTDYICSREDWELVEIYADEGISGTSAKKRPGFQRMIEDCRNGKIDIIITKSISRFARNTLDCLDYVQQLKTLLPPVAVIFERENINTLDSSSDLLLAILASVAQEESRTISENRRWSISKRYEMGNPFCPTNNFLGYETDEDGNMVINDEEAQTVRRIFREYIMGLGTPLIAGGLNEDGLKTGRGNPWYTSSVFRVIINEKYTGDVLMQKVFVPNYLTHKACTNRGELPQYYMENHHLAIIAREEWEMAQKEREKRSQMWNSPQEGYRQRHDTQSQIGNIVFCGECGSPMRRISSKIILKDKTYSVQNWRCRAAAYPKKFPIGCRAERCPEWVILGTFLMAKQKKYGQIPAGGVVEVIEKTIKSLPAGINKIKEDMRLELKRLKVFPNDRVEFQFLDGYLCAVPIDFISREQKAHINGLLYRSFNDNWKEVG